MIHSLTLHMVYPRKAISEATLSCKRIIASALTAWHFTLEKIRQISLEIQRQRPPVRNMLNQYWQHLEPSASVIFGNKIQKLFFANFRQL